MPQPADNRPAVRESTAPDLVSSVAEPVYGPAAATKLYGNCTGQPCRE